MKTFFYKIGIHKQTNSEQSLIATSYCGEKAIVDLKVDHETWTTLFYFKNKKNFSPAQNKFTGVDVRDNYKNSQTSQQKLSVSLWTLSNQHEGKGRADPIILIPLKHLLFL